MSTKKNPEAPVGPLEAQPHGGALAQGGPPNPKGIVRERAARYFDEHIETLARIAAGEEFVAVVGPNGEPMVDDKGEPLGYRTPSINDRINAIKTLGAFGIGVKVESTVDERRLLEVRVVYEGKPVAE